MLKANLATRGEPSPAESEDAESLFFNAAANNGNLSLIEVLQVYQPRFLQTAVIHAISGIFAAASAVPSALPTARCAVPGPYLLRSRFQQQRRDRSKAIASVGTGQLQASSHRLIFIPRAGPLCNASFPRHCSNSWHACRSVAQESSLRRVTERLLLQRQLGEHAAQASVLPFQHFHRRACSSFSQP